MLYSKSAVTALRRIHSLFPVLQHRRAHTFLTSSATCRLLRRPPRAVGATCPLRSGAFSHSACRWKNAGDGKEDEDEDDVIDDGEVEELFQERAPAGALGAAHRVFVVHPDVKWGSRKQHLTTGRSLPLHSGVPRV